VRGNPASICPESAPHPPPLPFSYTVRHQFRSSGIFPHHILEQTTYTTRGWTSILGPAESTTSSLREVAGNSPRIHPWVLAHPTHDQTQVPAGTKESIELRRIAIIAEIGHPSRETRSGTFLDALSSLPGLCLFEDRGLPDPRMNPWAIVYRLSEAWGVLGDTAPVINTASAAAPAITFHQVPRCTAGESDAACEPAMQRKSWLEGCV